MAVVGYIWVDPLEHSLEFQRDLLRKHDAHTVFEDVCSASSKATRTQLTAALDTIRAGDTLVVWRLDRLGSTLISVISLLELLLRRDVTVVSIADGLDTSGADGNGMKAIISAFTELERCLVRERTLVGVYAARARGRVGGRPRALSDTNVERVIMLRDQGATVREIAQEMGTSRATIYRVLNAADSEDPGPGE